LRNDNAQRLQTAHGGSGGGSIGKALQNPLVFRDSFFPQRVALPVALCGCLFFSSFLSGSLLFGGLQGGLPFSFSLCLCKPLRLLTGTPFRLSRYFGLLLSFSLGLQNTGLLCRGSRSLFTVTALFISLYGRK